MNSVWQKIPMWSKWLAALVGGLGALWVLIGWGADAYNHFEKADHHNQDIQLVLEEIAAQKKADRIQRNYRELQRVQRELIGEKYSNEAEKSFMLSEIKRLENAILCDEQGVCK